MLQTNNNRTEISSLGEFGLIDRISEQVKLTTNTVIKGIGDDAAVINPKTQVVVVSTDLLTENIHFDLSYVPLKHLGYKAVIVNLSDIFAMNAKPSQITVSIAVSSRFPVEAIDELYKGINLACEIYKVDLIGGDTTSSVSGLTISVTALGFAEENKLAYRNGAKENDLLVVSGNLGAAYLGLQILEREKAVFKEAPNTQPDLSGYDYLLERQLKPEARAGIVNLLEEKNIIPTSMIDVSDGLASEIKHICKQSDVGCAIYEEKIPIDVKTALTAEEFNLSPVTCALNGGEDYELLFTISQADYNKIKDEKSLHVIGHITNKTSGINLITKAEEVIELQAQGWDGLKE